jgi:hypothetical protein
MFGLPFTVCSLYLMHKSFRLQQAFISPFAALAFCTILLSGCFEASIFVGVGGLYLVVLIIPACATGNVQPRVGKHSKRKSKE